MQNRFETTSLKVQVVVFDHYYLKAEAAYLEYSSVPNETHGSKKISLLQSFYSTLKSSEYANIKSLEGLNK